MKYCIRLVLLLGLALCLGGCVSFNHNFLITPETVEIEGETWRTGFYGDDLWLQNMEFTGTEYEISGVRFRGLDCNGFACMQANIGGKTNGILYCLEAQWDDAAAYYGNPENFIYYCEIDAPSNEPERLAELETVDLEQWAALLGQSDAASYAPFDPIKNLLNERNAIDFDALELSPLICIRFYRESTDGKFVSSRGNKFFVWDGALYLSRYYSGKDHRISAAPIPEETAAYFLKIIESVKVQEGSSGSG